MLRKKLEQDKFYGFVIPITSVYMSDDQLANDKTAPLMMNFFPDSPREIFKLPVEHYTKHKVGHMGIFRKKFERDLWPLLTTMIEK